MRMIIFLALLSAVAYSHVVIDSRVNQADELEEEWWKGGVFYQIYPRSFQDTMGNGQGDIRGVINRLEHLKDLGVTGAWLNPIFKSPLEDGGYDIASFYEINDLFGTTEDLVELFAKAKELEIKIILDLVPNHTSDQHEWFEKSVNREEGFAEFYVWRECPMVDGERVYPNNWIAVFHTRAWTYHPDRDQCYLHQFLAQQPDLNYRNSAVEEEMRKVLIYWMDQGVDGFRIDAINHAFETEGLPNEPYIDENGDHLLYSNLHHIHTMDLDESYEMIFNWRQMMDEYAIEHGTTKKFMMTEAYAELDAQIRWYGTEERRGSHMPFNFALISNLNRNSKAPDFKEAIDGWLDKVPPFGQANWVLGNHDRPRIGYRYGEDRHESLALMTMLLPGINVIYYGEEILMTDNRAITWLETDDPQACQTNETVYQDFTRDPVRTPFQWDNTQHAGFSSAETTWLPVHANFVTQNLQAQKIAVRSTFKFYQHLLKLRKTEIFQEGHFKSKAIGDEVFGYVRYLEGHRTVVVFVNLGVSRTINIDDLLEASEIPANVRGTVLVVTNDSVYRNDELIPNPRHFELARHSAMAIELFEGEENTTPAEDTTTDSGATFFASFILLTSSLFLSSF